MNVSHVARLHGIQPSLLFKWKKQYREGQPHRRCGRRGSGSAWSWQLRSNRSGLQRLLGKKTMEVEILKEAVEYGQSRKWIAHAPFVAKDGE